MMQRATQRRNAQPAAPVSRAHKQHRVCEFGVLLFASVFLHFWLPAHALAAAPPATADAYPIRPLRFVVPATPGGGIDFFARLVGAKITEAWGQPVVVENRPGGGQTIGTEVVAKAVPDGYTLLFASNAHAVLPSLYSRLSFDSIRDFSPITLLATSANVLVVHPSLPARNVRDFITLAKANLRQINYGSSGNGGTGHLAMEKLKSLVGIDVLHVPYKTNAPLLTALISGEVPAAFVQIVVAAPQVRAGRLRALGVSTSRRSSALPQIPTIAEAGVPGFEAAAWFGVLAPAKTPSHVVAKLNVEMARIIKLPDVTERLSGEGADAIGNSPDQFAAVIRSDVEKWGAMIRALKIVAD